MKIIFKLFFGIVLTLDCVPARRLNITLLDNCRDENINYDVVPVELLTVKYDRDPVDGVCDTFHGTYVVRTIDINDLEMIITAYSCPMDTPIPCLDNPVEYSDLIDCNRFKTDSSGLWYMFSQSMSGPKCGEATGEFTLDSAQLKSSYLKNYSAMSLGRYRKKMLFHKKNTKMNVKNYRGCLELDFDIID